MKKSPLKTATKLALGFGAVIALIIALAAFSLNRMSAINAVVKVQNQLRTAKLEQLYVAREALGQTGLAARNAYVFKDEARANEELDLLDQQRGIYLRALETMAPQFGADPAFEKARMGLVAMAAELKRPRAYRNAGQMEAFGEFLVNECSPLRRRIVADIDVVVKSVQQSVDAQSRLAEAELEQSVGVILTVSGLAVLLSVAVGIIITRGLQKQLGGEPAEVARIARQVAAGDLTVQVSAGGDQRSVMHAMREMRDSLVGIVAEVRNGTSTIALASSEIASGNLDLSSRTERQAASLEETGAAMARLTSTVDRNADSARKSNAMVLEASNAAAKGGQVMDAVVDTMGVIAQSARKIADIIGVIDAIAFQTNILALNASVEAARAGAEGRGFAVVAAEVRNLAQRSAAAAKEIKQLIEGSVHQVDEGNRLVSKAGETMDEIASSVQRVTGMMSEILSVSQDQGNGIAQVNQAIEQMDQVTQSNAALVEQAAAAAASLQDQAMRLTQSVSVFKLETPAVQAQSRQHRIAPNPRAAPSKPFKGQPAGLLTTS